jgi:hypothetical protein
MYKDKPVYSTGYAGVGLSGFFTLPSPTSSRLARKTPLIRAARPVKEHALKCDTPRDLDLAFQREFCSKKSLRATACAASTHALMLQRSAALGQRMPAADMPTCTEPTPCLEDSTPASPLLFLLPLSPPTDAPDDTVC